MKSNNDRFGDSKSRRCCRASCEDCGSFRFQPKSANFARRAATAAAVGAGMSVPVRTALVVVVVKFALFGRFPKMSRRGGPTALPPLAKSGLFIHERIVLHFRVRRHCFGLS